MKQKILDALTTKFEGVDAKILDRIAAKLAKTVKTEDEVETAVDGVTFQDILTSYGDARATEASKTAVSSYEKKHGLKDGKKVAKDDDEPDDDDDDEPGDDDGDDDSDESGKKSRKAKKSQKKDDDKVPAWAKALIEGNKALKERLDAMDKGKVTASRREKLNKAIERLTEKQRKPYGRVSLDGMSDEEFDTFLEEVTEEAEELAAENDARDTFGAPLGGSHKGSPAKKATDKEIDEVADMLNI